MNPLNFILKHFMECVMAVTLVLFVLMLIFPSLAPPSRDQKTDRLDANVTNIYKEIQ